LTFGTIAAARAGALQLRLGHAHYLLRDAVGFLLVDVAGSVYGELWLNWDPAKVVSDVTRGRGSEVDPQI
jgi:hypothetical protein